MPKNIPVYRCKKNLSPTTIGDKKQRPSEVICCKNRSIEEQIEFCRRRRTQLEHTLKIYREQGNGFIDVVEAISDAIALELRWELELARAPTKTPNTISKPYTGLTPYQLQTIDKVAQTPKGVFYVKYSTDRVRGCSFVSRRRLTTAIAEIKQLKAVEHIWATQFGLGVKEEGGVTLEFGIGDIAPLLTRWNNGTPIVDSQPMQPSSFIQYKLKKEAVEFLLQNQFTHLEVEEEDETFLRVKRDQDFYGVLIINAEGQIYFQSSTQGTPLVEADDVPAAVRGLVSSFIPKSNESSTQPVTITQENWNEFKAIAKVGKLTTEETLAIVLDTKYLRILNPGEVASPRMVLAKHYPEIRQRLSEAATARLLARPKSAVFPEESDKREYARIESLYPRLFAKLRRLVDATFVHGLMLTDLVVHPFSVAIATTNDEILGRVAVTVEGFSLQIGNQIKNYTTAADMLAELPTPLRLDARSVQS